MLCKANLNELSHIWSHLLKKSLMENFIFCAVYDLKFQPTSTKSSLDEIFSVMVCFCFQSQMAADYDIVLCKRFPSYIILQPGLSIKISNIKISKGGEKMPKRMILEAWDLVSVSQCSWRNFENPTQESRFWIHIVRKLCHQISTAASSSRGKATLKIEFFKKMTEKNLKMSTLLKWLLFTFCFNFYVIYFLLLFRFSGSLRLWAPMFTKDPGPTLSDLPQDVTYHLPPRQFSSW